MYRVTMFKFINGEAHTMTVSMDHVEMAQRKGWDMGPGAAKAYAEWIEDGRP